MPALCLKEDYDAVPILTIVEPDDNRISMMVDVDIPTVDRMKAVIKAYWAVQHELRLLSELAEKEDEIYKLKKKINDFREGEVD